MAKSKRPLSGFKHISGYFDAAAQTDLFDQVVEILSAAPLYRPTMPKSGQPFSVMMSNCGPLGWVSDKTGGYRYQDFHPKTKLPWPQMPDILFQAWLDLANYPEPPEACLINWYDKDARMGLHVDQDEDDRAAPVLSVSLGDRARYRLGGTKRSGPTRSYLLDSGDVVLLGGKARFAYHGIDRIYPETSPVPGLSGRYNLTLRRVSDPG